jgi:hypothetical protein
LRYWRLLVALALLWPASQSIGNILLLGTASHAAVQPGLFADPRDYGATCGTGAGASTWNQNNATNDDAPGINFALATGLPVVIPFPGCKLVTQVAAPGHGATLFEFAGFGPDDALTGSNPALTQPYLYVPDAAKTNATNNCVFDTMGYEGVTWKNIIMIGQNEFNGTSAFCNSVGIANGRPQAFAHIFGSSISNMAGIGVATDSNCLPTGTLDAPVFQMTIIGLYEGHTCFGINANYSDTIISNWTVDNVYHACFTSPSGGGARTTISDSICEFNGHYDGGPLYNDGAAFYLNGAFTHLSNIKFDHIFGQCIVWDGHDAVDLASGWSGAVNIHCNNSNARDTGAGSFTGSISGTTLTITAVATGTVYIGEVITGAGVAANTTVTGIVSGFAFPGTGVFTVNNSQSVGSETLTSAAVANPCNYLFINEASFISASHMTALNFDTVTPYTLCFSGTQARDIVWEANAGGGPDTDGGWHTAFVHGTMPSLSHIEASSWGVFETRLPTTCSGAITGMQANVSGTITQCP